MHEGQKCPYGGKRSLSFYQPIYLVILFLIVLDIRLKINSTQPTSDQFPVGQVIQSQYQKGAKKQTSIKCQTY